VAGAAVLLEAFARFAIEGVGTPAPVAPTQELVVGGLYRYVQNPMYLAVAALTLGHASIPAAGCSGLRSRLPGDGLVLRALVRGAVLRRRFGAAYAEYASRVPGWWSRAPRAGKRL
jgi:protein-S-isoprenylcysteine O-methyltransferase Ste14